MAAKKKDKKSESRKKKSVKKQAKSTKNKSKSTVASKAKTKANTASKKSKFKKTTPSKTSVKKKNTSSAIKKKKSVSKKSSSSSAKKNKTLKKAVKKTLTASQRNLKNQASNNNKKSSPKKKVSKVKLTKADAARTTSAASASTPSKQPKLSKQNITKKAISSPKTENAPNINIEKVMEETEDKIFLPKSLQSSEKTAFSDSLSEDFSSVYARTSEDIPEPPGKYVMEFICKVSPELLYKFLTDPVELAEWFCDSVNVRNGIYTFVWSGVPQQARLVKQERNVSVRYQWLDKNDGSYFEFNIFKNYLTGDVVLYVTDFSNPEELESNKLWWTNQINKLKTILGLQY